MPPADPSSAVRPPSSFFEIVFSGGPIGVLIMLVLIGLSLLSVYLVCEQFMRLRKPLLLPSGLADQVRLAVQSGRIREAIATCQTQPSVLSFVLLHGLAEAEGGWSAVEKALEDALAEQSARLFRRVEYLSVLANLAPMLGLLGTVVGMVLCFQQVANTQGNAGAAQLAEGIYQALVTTVAGLIIAIPSLGAFAILRNRIDELMAEGAYLAQHALVPLKQARTAPSPNPRFQTGNPAASGASGPVGGGSASPPGAQPPPLPGAR